MGSEMCIRDSNLTYLKVADALIKLKLPNGGYLPGIEMFSPRHIDGPTKVCGPAFTVKVCCSALNQETCLTH